MGSPRQYPLTPVNIPQRLSVSHLRPAPSKLPPAALSPYLVKGPLTFSPTAYLTHKTLLFLINISQPSITCLCTENLQNPLEQVLILTLGKYATRKGGESNDALWGGKEDALSTTVTEQVSREGGGLQERGRALRAPAGFPWKGGWPSSLLINCVSNHRAYAIQKPHGGNIWKRTHVPSWAPFIFLEDKPTQTWVLWEGREKMRLQLLHLLWSLVISGHCVCSWFCSCFVWEPVSLKDEETTGWRESTPTHHENLLELLPLRWKLSCLLNGFNLS